MPLGIVLWITAALLQQSLDHAATDQLDRLSGSLEQTARRFYQDASQQLRDDAAGGRIVPKRFMLDESASWSAPIQDFWQSGEAERISRSGDEGNQLDYMVRGFTQGPGRNGFQIQTAPSSPWTSPNNLCRLWAMPPY